MVTLALTMGDAAGIGPELCVKAASATEFAGKIRFVIYGRKDILQAAADRWSNGVLPEVCECGDGELTFAGLHPCVADAKCGKAAYDALAAAVKDALSGKVDAIVTAPMNKYAVNLAGIPFTGHTERIAELCGTEEFAMMQSSGDLRAAFVTTHIALAEVSAAVTAERIKSVAGLLSDAIISEGITAPRIAAAAVNPHAGEDGCMGKEDEETVKPALAELRNGGMDIDGPFPPDVLFVKKIREKFDGLLSMYHDQGHIPFKMLAFDSGVNSTLGLPIIRTSPDHGTAFDIAWQGVADTGSFYAAVKLAAKRAEHRKK